MRTLGMGLGLLPVAMVLQERHAGIAAWAWAFFCGLVWPHLAYRLAARSRDAYRTELQNLVIDSALAASLVPLMHFSLLPSVMLVSVTTADKISSGVRGLWRRSLLPMLAALLVSGLLNGFGVDVSTSMNTLLACLPIMVIHTLAVSASSYQLVRRVQAQNLQLDKLSRFDSLTGLGSRAHWEAMASGLLQPAGRPATLMLVDVDRFKDTNDRHGHAVGDDLLRAIASCIQSVLPADGHAGRLGGDEFVVALPLPPVDAARIAESLLAQVQALEFPRAPGLRGSISIGLAAPPAGTCDLRAWLEAADRALYLAKANGRGRLQVFAAGPGAA
ncbi:diguanylate cyclase [Thermomonas sp. XSG]|uniref:diguanylate cyclase domain-containing protein n=1 Tax=Thermomonas sp. XSG TaxID=2771436 RepID=UPI001CC209F0|nr:diguanylate cyclase [Thermomonas sp. XSG]